MYGLQISVERGFQRPIFSQDSGEKVIYAKHVPERILVK